MSLKKALYQDNAHAVITASDWYAVGKVIAIPRSTTFNDPLDCWVNATVDPNLITPPGPKSMASGYVKVRVSDFHGFIEPPNKPMQTSRGKKIKDYPHPCHVCGGWMLQLFSSVEHEGGSCPGPKKKERPTW